MCDSVKSCDATELKVGLLKGAFQEPCFLWERWASVAVFFFFLFKIFYMHKNLYRALKKKKDPAET